MDYTTIARRAIAQSAASKARLATIHGEAKRNASRLIQSHNNIAEAGKAQAEINRLVDFKIEGFFPTPRSLASRMVLLADILPSHRVLEPEAGAGHIADAVRETCPDCDLVLVEWNYSLCSALRRKGYTPHTADFLEWEMGKFDRVVMNPPFEGNQDIAHIRRAFDMLTPRGRLVAIASSGILFGNGKRAEFREWLDSRGAEVEKLPDDTFKHSDRPTGVQTCLITIDRQ